MFQFLLIWFAERGRYKLRIVGLSIAGAAVIYLVIPPLLHDVLGIGRSDGARCEKDSNCLSQFCRHPESTPAKAYCSRQCDGDGHCAEGMRCAQTVAAWECVTKAQLRYGELCGEDSECALGRCALLSAFDGEWLPPSSPQKPDFQGAFCVVSCSADPDRCPLGDSCAQLNANKGPVCVPQGRVRQAAFAARRAIKGKKAKSSDG